MFKKAFSLMEMMVVLLIVAVVAAASAPMLSRKQLEKANAESPWVYTPGGSIVYDVKNTPTSRVLIGRVSPPNNVNAKLYIETPSDNSVSQIALGVGTTTPHLLWATDGGGISISKSTSAPAANSISSKCAPMATIVFFISLFLPAIFSYYP